MKTVRDLWKMKGSKVLFPFVLLIPVCGGTFSSIEGKIASPNYPFSYPRNVECIYLITAEPGNAIELTFDFELEDSDHCADDYIEVRESDGAGQVVDAFCGNGRRELKVNGTAWIKFKSDEDETRKGFIVSHRYGKPHQGLQLLKGTSTVTNVFL